jgi:hypothetical protein
MKATTTRLVSSLAALLACSAAWSGAGAVTEEMAVVQAMAKLLNEESLQPFDYLYFESDFTARKNVAASMSDPDRTQFCGLSRDEGIALVREITLLNLEPLAFDKSLARLAGLELGHKRFPRYRYIRLSRVVFAPGSQHAWLAADANGESGAIYRMDKVDGQWSRTARCGGWVKAGD